MVFRLRYLIRLRLLRQAVLTLVLGFAALPALARSVALVVGNDAYTEIEPLRTARADSEAYARLLGALGFTVALAHDADARAMAVALAAFYDSIEPGDTVVLVYSGHGWSDGERNFLLPTDIRPEATPTLLAQLSFPLRNGASGILDEIAARQPGLTVAIIDACRNNPFSVAGKRAMGLGRGMTAEQAASGSFVAFSAGVGQTALDRLGDDDPAPTSVFSRVFLQELAKPQDLQTAFKVTQIEVNRLAATVGHDQRPAYYDEVLGLACLSPGCAGAPGGVDAAPAVGPRHAPPGPASPDPATLEAAATPSDAPPVPPMLVPPEPGPPPPVQCGGLTGQAALICAVAVLNELQGRIDAGYDKAVLLGGGTETARLTAAHTAFKVRRAECGMDPACLERLFRGYLGGLAMAAAAYDQLDPAERVRRTQQELIRLGCMAGPADGVAGDSTRAALAALERASGLPLEVDPAGALLLLQLKRMPEGSCPR
jgi:hypothetical protein